MKLILIILLSISSAYAVEPILVIDKGEYYYLLPGPELKKVSQVIIMPGVNIPPTSNITSWATAVGDPENAQAIAIIYKEAAELVLDDNIWEAVKKSTDTLLLATGKTDDWKPFRVKLSALINEYTSAGKLDNKLQIKGFFLRVSNELNSSVPSDAKKISHEYAEGVQKTVRTILNELS